MLGALKLLARLKFLRGTALDVFGHTAERRMERALQAGYEADLERILEALAAGSAHPALLGLARLPESVRGYGHVKAASAEKARQQHQELLRQLEGGGVAPAV